MTVWEQDGRWVGQLDDSWCRSVAAIEVPMSPLLEKAAGGFDDALVVQVLMPSLVGGVAEAAAIHGGGGSGE